MSTDWGEHDTFESACDSALLALTKLTLMDESSYEVKTKAQIALTLVKDIIHIGY